MQDDTKKLLISKIINALIVFAAAVADAIFR